MDLGHAGAASDVDAVAGLDLRDGGLRFEHEHERLLDVDRALQRLAADEPRLVRLVECLFFAGLGEQETAEALGVSLRTVQRDWLRARAALRRELASGP